MDGHSQNHSDIIIMAKKVLKAFLLVTPINIVTQWLIHIKSLLMHAAKLGMVDRRFWPLPSVPIAVNYWFVCGGQCCNL